MKIKTSCKAGFTLVEIMIVVGIIGLLAVIAIPNLGKSRETARMAACIANLNQIDGAKQLWASEKGKTGPDTPTAADITPYLGRGAGGSLASVYCPLNPPPAGNFDSSYTIGDMNTVPLCKIGGVGGTKYDANYPHTLP